VLNKLPVKGGLLGIIIVSALNVANFIMNDSYTLSHFIGDMVTDVAVIAASAAAGYAVGAIMIATGAVAAFTVGPLVVAALVTFFVGTTLGALADKYGISAKITNAMDKTFDYIEDNYERLPPELQRVLRTAIKTSPVGPGLSAAQNLRKTSFLLRPRLITMIR